MRLWARVKAFFGGPASLGARGEREAARLLRGAGFTILAGNLRATWGEVDLLAEDPDGRTIVVVEVKARKRKRGAAGASVNVAPEASITRAKQRKLIRLMDALTVANGWQGRPKRIDVVAVEFIEREQDDEVVTRHFRDAVKRPRR